LVQEGNSIYLTSDRCTTSGAVLIDTIANIVDAKMRQVGSEFRIAVRHGAAPGANLNYYRVSGTTVTNLRRTPGGLSGAFIALHGTGTNRYFYDIDGNGYLYAITGAAQVTVYDANGSDIANVAIPGAGATATGLLAFADRVLVKDTTNNAVHSINETATRAAVGIDFNAVNRCTQIPTTRAIDGVGTNFIRCVFDDGGGAGNAGLILYSLTFDGAVYGSASSVINNAAHTAIGPNDVRFGVGRVLVFDAANNIRLCTTTNTNPPNISCSTTNLPSVNPTNLITPANNIGYLKSNGNNVFYDRNIVNNPVNPPEVGNIFGPPSALQITLTPAPPPAGPLPLASGGNASFDLTKFAFSFRPPTAPPGCNTHVAYLSSPTATPKLYALPSGSCVARILKTFP
jgi:hypothetical protein